MDLRRILTDDLASGGHSFGEDLTRLELNDLHQVAFYINHLAFQLNRAADSRGLDVEAESFWPRPAPVTGPAVTASPQSTKNDFDSIVVNNFLPPEATLSERLDNPDGELNELRALFALQQTRMAEATARWRAEDPATRANVLPDLGALLEWLMAAADRHGPSCGGQP